MGTEIYLRVGNVMVDWSKNSRGGDHGVLFQDQDRTRISPDAESALVRSLKATVPRLDLLGFTVANAEAAYGACVSEWTEVQRLMEEDGTAEPIPLTFTEFVEFLGRHPLNVLDDTYTGASGPAAYSGDRAHPFRSIAPTCA